MTVEVRNRQRLLKVNTVQLRQLAERALEVVGWRATLRRGRSERRARRSAPLQDRFSGANLSIVLVSDRQMAELNLRYHHTDGPTDILSFDYGEGQGELVISVEHAVAQAKRFRSTPALELGLYVVHGILHLHRYDDGTPAQRRRMRSAERRLLARLRRTVEFGKLF